MKDKLLVETGLVAIIAMVFIVALIAAATFSLNPTTEVFNSLLLIAIIGAQLITVVVLVKIYEKIGGGRK